MQSLFELKTKLPFDSNVFESMKETAVKLLYNAERGEYTQAIVLFSVTGNKYGTIIKNALSEEKLDEKSLLERLNVSNDTEIRYVLCMWQDTCIDIPSFDFRKLLYALNSKNSESLLFVMTAKGVSGIKLSTTIK